MAAGSACTSSFSRFAQRSLALRPAHSRRSPIRDPLSEGFSHFVSSMTAPVASGWSDWPGGACTHWKAPPCHGARHFRSFRLARRVRMPSGLVYNCGHRADLDGHRRGQSQGFGYRRYCSRRIGRVTGLSAATRCRSSRQFRWRHRISIRDTAPYSRSLNVRADTSHNAHSPKSLKGKGLLIGTWC